MTPIKSPAVRIYTCHRPRLCCTSGNWNTWSPAASGCAAHLVPGAASVTLGVETAPVLVVREAGLRSSNQSSPVSATDDVLNSTSYSRASNMVGSTPGLGCPTQLSTPCPAPRKHPFNTTVACWQPLQDIMPSKRMQRFCKAHTVLCSYFCCSDRQGPICSGVLTLGGFSPACSGLNSPRTSVTLPPDFSNPVHVTMPAYLQRDMHRAPITSMQLSINTHHSLQACKYSKESSGCRDAYLSMTFFCGARA